MLTKPKIKIVDNPLMREEIVKIYQTTNQILLAKWSISISKHILSLIDIDYETVDIIKEGFYINELWQAGKVGVHEVRQSSFKVHKLAREINNIVYQTALRVVGQALASGHMREHSLVASDYAIKVIGLVSSNDLDSITKERLWQRDELNKILRNNEKYY